MLIYCLFLTARGTTTSIPPRLFKQNAETHKGLSVMRYRQSIILWETEAHLDISSHFENILFTVHVILEIRSVGVRVGDNVRHFLSSSDGGAAADTLSLPTYLSITVYIYLSILLVLSAYLSSCLYVCLAVCQLFSLSLCSFVCLSVCRPSSLSVCFLSAGLCICICFATLCLSIPSQSSLLVFQKSD